jgi:hypothetical protein
MRRVQVDSLELVRNVDGKLPTFVLKRTPRGEAVFHQFGVSFEEFESGPGNYSTAIVEWPDGRVEAVPVNCIQFIEPTVL